MKKQAQQPLHENTKTPFRSVGSVLSGTVGENLTERGIYNIYNNTSINGTERSVPLKEGVRGRKQINADALAFAAAVKGGDETAFFDERFPTDAIIIALTCDWKSLRRWHQFERVMPSDVLREELAAFYAEIRAGEDVSNRGAALNARLGRKAGL